VDGWQGHVLAFIFYLLQTKSITYLMIDKPYGKFTLEQFKQFNELVHDTRNLVPTFEKVMREADPQKLNAILGANFSWFHYYEMPFNDHITWSVLILD
jgi:hypothetical protein